MVRKRRPRRIGGPTAAEITEWHEARDRGESLASIGNAYGIDKGTVAFYTPGCKGTWGRVTKKGHVEKWIERRSKGESCFSIALDFDVSTATVFYHTKHLPNCAKPGPKRRFDRDKILALLQNNISSAAISERIGCSLGYPSVLKSKIKQKEQHSEAQN